MIGVERVGTWVRRRRAVRRRFNPYVFGPPVLDRALLFGRGASTTEALARLELGNVRVVGERRIGKTSFLHHLRSLLSLQPSDGRDTIPVFVDLESVPGSDLLEALLEETIDVLAVWSAERVEPCLAAGRSPSELLRLCARMVDDVVSRTRRGLRLVFLIDEIDVLGDGGNVSEAFGSLSGGLSAEVRFVTAGAGRKGSVSRESAPGRTIFGEVELPPLSAEDAEALVRRPVAGVFDFEADAVARILGRSRLRPYLIQKLSARALDRMLDDRRTVCRPTDVDAASGPWLFAERSSTPNTSDAVD